MQELKLQSVQEVWLEKIKTVLDELDALGIEYQITGSLGMKILGILDRAPRDLDLVVSWTQREKIIPLKESPTEHHSVNKNDIAMGSKYYSKEILGVQVCFFERSLQTDVQREFMGKSYAIGNPVYSIEAKLVILKNRLHITGYSMKKALQHSNDILQYFMWLDKMEQRGLHNPFTPKKIVTQVNGSDNIPFDAPFAHETN